MSSESSSTDMSSSLLRIRETIEKEGQLELEKIKNETEAQIKKILEDAKREAELKKAKILEEGKKEAEILKRREISRVSLQTKLDYLKYRETLVQGLFEDLKAELVKYTNTPEYLETLKAFIKQGALTLNGGDIIVSLREQDASKLSTADLDAIAKDVSNEIKQPVNLELRKEFLHTIGGVELKTKDGNIIVTNTFEELIDRKLETLRQIIHSELK